MSLRLATPTIVSALLMAQLAVADSASGDFSVRGIGAQSCQALNERAATDVATLEYLAIWSAGYLTHANRITGQTYEVMPIADNATVARVVAALCQTHPDAMVETALASLVAALAGASVAESGATITLTAGDASISLLQDVLIRVQQQLIARGLLPEGSSDGRYGPQTRDALTTFQAKNGLAETGLPDPATLLRLLAN